MGVESLFTDGAVGTVVVANAAPAPRPQFPDAPLGLPDDPLGEGFTIYIDEPKIVSAVPPLPPTFPDAPFAPVPDPYDGAIEPDDFFCVRNECDGCERGLGDGYDMIVTKTVHGHIETFCPACYCQKYLTTWLWRQPLARTHAPLSKKLVYVNVLQGGKFYRWQAPK